MSGPRAQLLDRFGTGIDRAAQTFNVPILRTSYALILTTALNAVLGLSFWVAAARLYPTRTVGLGAGGISALQLAASFGWIGLQFTLMRYVPAAGVDRRRLVGRVYTAGACVGVLGAAVFILTLSHALKVPYLDDNAPSAIVFCISVVVWVVFSLQDAVLIGIRRSLLVPAENVLYGVLKLVLLIALSSIHDPWTLLGVWVGAAGALAVAVNALLFARLLETDTDPSTLPDRRTIVSFSIGHTAVAVASSIPDLVVPLLILRYRGAVAASYYYAAWTIGFSARLVVMNLSSALTVEASYATNSLRRLTRSASRLACVLLPPVILFLLVGAGLVLRIFGPAYVVATGLLRLFALSLAPFAVATFVTTLDRVRERFNVALTIAVIGAVTTIALDFVLVPRFGITGAGVGWLIGQLAASIAAVVSFRQVPELRDRLSSALDDATVS